MRVYIQIGAGIQVTPNLSRILIKWGLKEKLDNLGEFSVVFAVASFC